MSLGARDAAAYDLATRRVFGEGAYSYCVLVALELEMQTRRLTMRLYGTLRSPGIGEPKSYLSTVTFFGATALTLGEDADDGAFPQSAKIESLSLRYDDQADEGHAHVTGTRGWSIDFRFDGIAFEETPATIASLVDDDDDATLALD